MNTENDIFLLRSTIENTSPIKYVIISTEILSLLPIVFNSRKRIILEFHKLIYAEPKNNINLCRTETSVLASIKYPRTKMITVLLSHSVFKTELTGIHEILSLNDNDHLNGCFVFNIQGFLCGLCNTLHIFKKHILSQRTSCCRYFCLFHNAHHTNQAPYRLTDWCVWSERKPFEHIKIFYDFQMIGLFQKYAYVSV